MLFVDEFKSACEYEIHEDGTFVQKFQWRESKKDPPRKENAGHYGKVIVWQNGALDASTVPWDLVAKMPECYPYWMPLPELPKELLEKMDGEEK